MFTGLIQDIGLIKAIEKSGDWTITIQTNLALDDLAIGASICCSGCCLTVIQKQDDCFLVDVSQESLDKTIIQNWKEGVAVNLEPSLRLGDELGGHFVFGHVDMLAKIVSLRQENDSHRLKIEVLNEFTSYIASKGSVALDGISLTVNEVDGNIFGVNIIPHTWENTTLKDRVEGDFVNLEIDMLARYVAKQVQFREEG